MKAGFQNDTSFYLQRLIIPDIDPVMKKKIIVVEEEV